MLDTNSHTPVASVLFPSSAPVGGLLCCAPVTERLAVLHAPLEVRHANRARQALSPTPTTRARRCVVSDHKSICVRVAC